MMKHNRNVTPTVTPCNNTGVLRYGICNSNVTKRNSYARLRDDKIALTKEKQGVTVTHKEICSHRAGLKLRRWIKWFVTVI